MAGFNPVITFLGDNKRDVYGSTPTAMPVLTFTGTDTYLTGGFALTAALFGLDRPIAGVLVIGGNTANAAIDWEWNTQTQKLMAQWMGTAFTGVFQEVANATVIANFALTLLVFGQR